MAIGGKFVVYTVFKAVDKQSGSIRGIGLASQRAAIGVGLVGGAAIITAAKFQRAMNVVESVASNGSKSVTGLASDMKLLTAKARELGASTEQNPIQIAESMERLVRSGLSAKAVLSSIEPVVKGTIANNSDLETTTKLLVSTMNAFKLNKEDPKTATEVMDAISFAASRTAADVESLTEGMQYASSNAKAFGTDYKKTLLSLGFLSNIGITNSRGGTQMKNLFQRLPQQASLIKKLTNVDVANKNGDLRDFATILKEIGEATNKMPQIDKMNAFKDIFGAIASAGGLALSGDLTQQISSFEALIADSEKMAGTTGKMYGIITKGGVAAFNEMTSAITELAISIANSGLLEYTTKVLKGVKSVVTYLSKVDDSTKNWILGLGGAVIAVGAISKTIMGIHATMEAIAAIKAFTGIASVGGAVANGGAVTAGTAVAGGSAMGAFIAGVVTIALPIIIGMGLLEWINSDAKKLKSELDAMPSEDISDIVQVDENDDTYKGSASRWINDFFSNQNPITGDVGSSNGFGAGDTNKINLNLNISEKATELINIETGGDAANIFNSSLSGLGATN